MTLEEELHHLTKELGIDVSTPEKFRAECDNLFVKYMEKGYTQTSALMVIGK